MKDLMNQKREEMHKVMNSKDVKYEEILKISEELDELIVKYYKMKSNRNDTRRYE